MSKTLRRASLVMALAGLCVTPSLAQGPAAPPETWWALKTKGGDYVKPNRPLWKLADLKRMHAGQANWQEQIIKDPLQEATYNSAAPGTKFISRMHPDGDTVYVVVAGEIHFTVEGQQPVTAKRGSIINILHDTIFSYDVEGADNALWVEINPLAYKMVYPGSDPAPKAGPGRLAVKTTFQHKPPAYTGSNMLYRNTFEAIAACQAGGTKLVSDDHIFLTSPTAYVNPADNKCPVRAAGANAAAGTAMEGKFNPRSVFGHMHVGWTEWWIVQVGGISGKFENAGEFHAVEGDVLYAPPNTWHQMGVEAPSGPSVRLAVSGYDQFNMFPDGAQPTGP